jgi:hypothetical protein
LAAELGVAESRPAPRPWSEAGAAGWLAGARGDLALARAAEDELQRLLPLVSSTEGGAAAGRVAAIAAAEREAAALEGRLGRARASGSRELTAAFRGMLLRGGAKANVHQHVVGGVAAGGRDEELPPLGPA